MEYEELKTKVLQFAPADDSHQFTIIWSICDILNEIVGYRKYHSYGQILYDNSDKVIIDPAKCYYDKTETYFQGLSDLIDKELLLYKLNLVIK